ncbi:MAG: OB-fold domain-containing protein [Neomegalonema sp.]|nr:OB-fold domain-containing protein [Neomegalonema sp.]
MSEPARSADALPAMGPEARYFEALREGRFTVQRCDACARTIFPPRILCPACMSEDLSVIEPTGLGEVYSTTTVRRPADKGGDYNVAIITLAEGVQMMSCVKGIAPASVRIGMRVRAEVVDGRVEFTPEGSAS